MKHKKIIPLALILIGFNLVSVRSQTIKDIDGNVYNTVTIGTQVWLSDNLKTTRYNNGDSIGTTFPVNKDISNESSQKFQWIYGGDSKKVDAHGRLYTWYAVIDDRKICPSGWHLPSDAEWTILTSHLTDNGFGFQGSGSDIAKSMAVTSGWINDIKPGNVGNDQLTNNSSGFNGNFSGYRGFYGAYSYIGRSGNWWTATHDHATYAWTRYILNYSDLVYRSSYDKQSGYSVRCLKDN